MADERIVQVVELDLDYCTRTWGQSPCMASFSSGNVRRCYNTFPTCQYKQAFNKTSMTLRFIEQSFPVKVGDYMPALVSVSGREQKVNIGGFVADMEGLGERARVDISITDFPSRDVQTDKYWAGRMDGSAQTNEGGYDPLDRGSFWSKLKARNPNYAGRPLRVIQAHYTASGALVYDKVRHYVITEIDGPSDSGSVKVIAKDILALADNEKALAPKTSQGRLRDDITASQTSFAISPASLAGTYPASGTLVVGSEIMTFSRSGATFTVVRGRQGTQAATHSVNDTVQVAFNVNRTRADSVIRNLLVNYANIPSSYINFSEWQAEFDRWGGTLVLDACICKPTGVTKLLSEISQLGITLWWDELAQKIRIKLNRPPEEVPKIISDRNNIMSIKSEDNEDERATQVSLWTVQIDPTKDLNQDNFIRNYITVYVDGESPNYHNETTTKTIYTRWLNQGNDAGAKIITGRLLMRYRHAPVTYTIKLDAKDDLQLTEVVQLDSHVATDLTGLPDGRLTQVFYRADDKAGSTITAKLQRFLYDSRFGYITENSRPNYNSSSEAQKLRGAYFVGPSLTFADGRGPYRFI